MQLCWMIFLEIDVRLGDIFLDGFAVVDHMVCHIVYLKLSFCSSLVLLLPFLYFVNSLSISTSLYLSVCLSLSLSLSLLYVE